MMTRIIGVNIPGGTTLAGLDAALARIHDDGWQAAELNLSSCPLIIGGRIMNEVVSYMAQVMARYDLRYTAHASYGLDLRDIDDGALHEQVLMSSVKVCPALGIDRLNVHYEQKAADQALEERFRRLVRQAADLGASLGVAVNVENIEVEDCRYALQAVKDIDHPNVGMTLDLGHLFISSRYFGFDYLDMVRQCAPYVRHLHINDNDGVFEPMRLSNQQLYNTLDKGYRFSFSRGDVHIPPFWGQAPLAPALGILKRAGYDGVWLCEYYSHLFSPLNAGIRQRVQDEIERA